MVVEEADKELPEDSGTNVVDISAALTKYEVHFHVFFLFF